MTPFVKDPLGWRTHSAQLLRSLRHARDKWQVLSFEWNCFQYRINLIRSTLLRVKAGLFSDKAANCGHRTIEG